MEYLYPTDYMVIGFGVAILAIWVILFVMGYRNRELFDTLPEEDYPMKELYFVGFALLDRIKKEYKTAGDRKLRRDLSILYGERYADFYIRAVYCKQITMGLLVLAVAAPFYCLTGGSVLVFLVVVAGACVTGYYYGTTTPDKIKKRGEEMLIAFSNVVSKLALLINSGMIMKDAWERVAYSGDGVLYQEMQRSIQEMDNGRAEEDALYDFGQRCVIPEIKKFTSTVIQGLHRGNRELANSLTQQSKEVWNLKRQIVRRQGEMANSKLMIPICLTFIGILVMVIVPIFTNIGV